MTSKSVFFSFAILLISLTAVYSQDCNKLSDGKYKARIKTKGYDDYFLVLHDSTYKTIRENGEEDHGKIRWLSDCTFVLDNLMKKNSSDTSFMSTIHNGWGELCYEITDSNKQIFRLTWSRNLHVQIYEGRFKKVAHKTL